MRVDSTMSECAPDASSQPTPPSGKSDRPTVIPEQLASALASSPLSLGAHRQSLSFDDPNTIAQIRSELELLALDGTPQTVLQLTKHRLALQRLGHRRPIRAPDM